MECTALSTVFYSTTRSSIHTFCPWMAPSTLQTRSPPTWAACGVLPVTPSTVLARRPRSLWHSRWATGLGLTIWARTPSAQRVSSMALNSAMWSILREALEPSKSEMYLLHLPQLVMGFDLVTTMGEIFVFIHSFLITGVTTLTL